MRFYTIPEENKPAATVATDQSLELSEPKRRWRGSWNRAETTALTAVRTAFQAREQGRGSCETEFTVGSRPCLALDY